MIRRRLAILLVVIGSSAVSIKAEADFTDLPDDSIRTEILDSPPTRPAGTNPRIVRELPKSATILSEVPTSTWTYGCTATAAGMIFGYYDRHGFPNMYTGPTNGGVVPLTNLGQGDNPQNPINGACSLIATQNGFDGRTIPGHVDDYWISYGSHGPDPWTVEGGGNGVEHPWGDCVADCLGTNQWKWSNDKSSWSSDGSTRYTYYTSGARYYDPIPSASHGLPQTQCCHGMRLFAESRGYTVLENYNQLVDAVVDSGGFSFDDYMTEINRGCPVLLHVRGHSMTGIGYDEVTQTVYLHDTWDNNMHSMTWGGSYSGMEMRAVTIIHIERGEPRDWYVSAETEPGGDGTSLETAFDTIQKAIDASSAVDGDTVWIDDGVYQGDGNWDLDMRGKAITLRSIHGPVQCVIDCQEYFYSRHRGVSFTNGESQASILDGLTIINGLGPLEDPDSDGETVSCGGAIYCEGTSPTIQNCIIKANRASLGGAIYSDNISSPIIRNCLIVDNLGMANGGAVYCSNHSGPSIINCTITGNQASEAGGGVYCQTWCTPTLRNTIVWDNQAPEGPEIYNALSMVSASYSCIQGGWVGECNIVEPPVFSDDPVGLFTLQAGSPCINRGSLADVEVWERDLVHNPRVSGGSIDIGACEFQQMKFDYDADNDVDLADFASFQVCFSLEGNPRCIASFDADQDGDVDKGDYSAFEAILSGK